MLRSVMMSDEQRLFCPVVYKNYPGGGVRNGRFARMCIEIGKRGAVG
jgi:hypothetical protein